MASSYYDLVQAIANYYGVGSDQWLTIVNQGISSAEAYNILKQVPNVEIAVSESGKVLSYSVKAVESVTSTGVGSAVNSNLLPSVVESSNIIEVPGEFVAQEAGKVSVKSGLASAGNFVVKEVIPAVMAAGVGIQLGKAIDKALYNANPEYWDSIGLETLNPDIWGDIIGTNTAGEKVARLLLGIKSDNSTQAYIDENAFAYMALALQNQGWFSEAGINLDKIEPTTTLTDNEKTLLNSIPYPIPILGNSWFSQYILRSTGEVDTSLSDTIYTNISDPRINHIIPISYYSSSSSITDKYERNHVYILTSSSPCQIVAPKFNGNRNVTININYKYTKNGKSVYVGTVYGGEPAYPRWFSNDISTYVNYNSNYFTIKVIGELAWQADYGSSEISAIDGITNAENATLPQLTGISTVPEVLEALKQTYPDIFANKITNNVVQPDGNIIPYNYVPIPLPIPSISGNALNSNQPISSTPTQTDPKVDPNTAPSDLLDYVSGLLGKPVTPTDVPTTGEGTTPPFVLPTGSASALFKIYNPTITELNSFGGWLWSDNFIQQIKKLFNDPMQAIIGLHKVYCTPNVAGRSNIVVGYLDSGVASNYIGSQYVDVECGSIDVVEYFGNVMDYEPFTKISIYLPFIGIVPLSTGEVMRSTISVTYHIDVLSGACLAEVNIKRDNAGGVLYTFTGDCAERYPISAGSYMSLVGAVAGIAGGAIAGLTGGLGLLPVALGGVSALSHASTDVKHTGSFNGNAGALGIKKPYLIITRKQSDLADSFPKIDGYPANYSTTLGACSGYTVVENIHITGISATDEELKELKSLLQKGVIF